MGVEIVRTKGGLWAPGHSANPEGGRVLAAKRRLECALARKLEKKVCYESAADRLVEGMLDPDEYPVAAKLAYERLWPAVKHVDGSVGIALAVLGEVERRELADVFGEEIPEGTQLDLEPVAGSSETPGAD